MKTQTMMTTAAMVTCMAMGWGCTEPDPRGELTDTVCFDGLWNPFTSYDTDSDVVALSLVADGQASMRIGRVREGDEGPATWLGANEGWCDFESAPAIERVEFGPGLDAAIDHEVDGNTITLTTGRGGMGTMRVETALGELEVELEVAEAASRDLTAQVVDRSDDDVLRVVAGSRLALDPNATTSNGQMLRGVTEWGAQDLWTFEGAVTTHAPYSHTPDEEWVEFQGVRVTAEVGSYEVPGGAQTRRVEVVPASAVHSVEVCAYDWCVRDGEELTVTSSPSYTRDGWEFELDVVLRDTNGEVVEGVPGDFAVELPADWRDLDGDLSAIGSAYRRIAVPDGEGSGDVVVRAHGRVVTVNVYAG